MYKENDIIQLLAPLDKCGCNNKNCYYCGWLKGRVYAITPTETAGKNTVFEIKTPEDVLNAICKIDGVTPQEIKSSRRSLKVVVPRQVYCMFAREATNAPHKIIGEIIGRDRTAVIGAIKRAKDVLSYGDKAYIDLYNQLKSSCLY